MVPRGPKAIHMKGLQDAKGTMPGPHCHQIKTNRATAYCAGRPRFFLKQIRF